MKEEIVIFLKRFGGYIVGFLVIGYWVWGFATGHISNKTSGHSGKTPIVLETNNPRDKIGTDTLHFKDSTYIVSTKIDTVYKRPEK
jgi:hypothetical protein